MQYMLLSDENKIAQEWQKYEGYTVRPLPSSIQYYKNKIKHYGYDSQFLLYGGTPEIRNIFQELNYPVVILDRSLDMVRAMGLLTRANTPIASNEHFI